MSIRHIADAEFQETVLNSQTLVLVDFWAAWCAPCRALEPALKSIAEDFASAVSVVKLNVDDNPQSPQSFGVHGIPTLILFKEGVEIARHVGMTSRESIAKLIEAGLALTTVGVVSL